MATHEFKTYSITPFWNGEYKHLPYIREPFNDAEQVNKWVTQGFGAKITGELCDMRFTLPTWASQFVDYYTHQGWKDVGIAFYRMTSGTVMPEHSDLYKRYVNMFNLSGQEHTIRRALVLLEDWQQGHYLDCMGTAFVMWKAGDVVEWAYDTPHTAANIGTTDRYTLQITGHK
jgi:hypothetical protein